MGVVTVLAADEAPGGVVAVGDDLGGLIALHAVEAHPAQGVLLIALLVGVVFIHPMWRFREWFNFS